MLRTALVLLLASGAGYVSLLLLLFMRQDRLLYAPTAAVTMTPAQRDLPFTPVRFDAEDGETLHGWWVPAAEERGVLLYCHGNAGNMAGRLDSIALFHRLGLSVFIFDYRGYGHSTGAPSEEGLYRDGEAAWRYLTETRGLDPARIVVFGRSLGGGVASWLAVRHPAGALILDSTFTSVPAMAALQYPLLPTRLLTRIGFDNLERVRRLEVPLLVAHSPDDELIPFDHGRQLFEAARAPKRFVQLAGRHGDSLIATGERYLDAIDAFLRAHLDAA